MARLLMMTDFTESYANKLLQGIMRYSHEHDPWVVAKIPLSFRDSNQLKTVADIAGQWKADAIIGQFRGAEDVRPFREKGIIPIAQDFKQPIPGIINITGDYKEAGHMAARYFMERGVRHFAFYGKHDFRQHKMVYQVQSFGLTAVGGEVTLFFVSLKRNAEVIAVAVKR